MLWFYENDSIFNANLLAFTKTTTDTFNKNKRCYVTLKGLSSVYAKLELASSKNNEILAINVLQKFTSLTIVPQLSKCLKFEAVRGGLN